MTTAVRFCNNPGCPVTAFHRRAAMAGMLEGVAARTFAPLLLRAALAAVFIYHGLEKVHPETHYGLKWAEGMGAGAPQVLTNAPPLQLLVAWGELLGGVAVA